MVAGLLRVARMTRQASPVQDPRWLESARQLAARFDIGAVALLETDAPDVLATWGARRPCILLPARSESWSDARIHVVLCHELAHIRRADWPVQIAAEIVRTVFWFNPLFWIACARLRRESEQACDDAVLAAGVPPSEYASHLVEIARACRPVSPLVTAMPIARPSTLEWRITAMLNASLSRTAPSRRTLAFAVLVLLAVTIPVASFRAAAQDGPLPFVGTVYDMSGGVLPGVTLTIADAAGTTKTATTDGSGQFEFEPIGPGTYVLSSHIPGFLPLRQAVTLKNPRHWDRAITLQVGHSPGDHHGRREQARRSRRGTGHATHRRPESGRQHQGADQDQGRQAGLPAGDARRRLRWRGADGSADRRRRQRDLGPRDQRASASRSRQGRGGRRSPVAVHSHAAERRPGGSVHDGVGASSNSTSYWAGFENSDCSIDTLCSTFVRVIV